MSLLTCLRCLSIMRVYIKLSFWLSCLPPPLPLCVLSEGCVCATWTGSDEMNSSERWGWLWKNWKKARANVTTWAWRELHRYVFAVCRHETVQTLVTSNGFVWAYLSSLLIECVCPGGYQVSTLNSVLHVIYLHGGYNRHVSLIFNLSDFRIKKLPIKHWSRGHL